MQPEPRGKLTAILASMVGLVLVWTVVWANLPSREKLLSEQPYLGDSVPPPVPELDLTIPGVSPVRQAGEAGLTSRPAESKPSGAVAAPDDTQAKLIRELKCDAEVQQVCPMSLREEERRQCMARSKKQLSVPCRRMVQERLANRK